MVNIIHHLSFRVSMPTFVNANSHQTQRTAEMDENVISKIFKYKPKYWMNLT